MLKRTIVYTNPFTEEKVTEEHYFHISKADLVEMEMEEYGSTYMKDGVELTGMQAKLEKIVDSKDGKTIMAEFKDIIRRAYGKKDGDRFVRSRAIWEEFESSEAYSQLLFELCTNAEASAAFVNGIVPSNLEQIAAEVKQEAAKTGHPSDTAAQTAPANPEETKPMTRLEERETATPQNPVILTNDDIAEMDSDDLKSGLATQRYKLS